MQRLDDRPPLLRYDLTQYSLNSQAGAPVIFAIDFAAANFQPSYYADYDINYPGAISRSTGPRQAEFFFGRLAAQLALADMGMHGHEIAIGVFREPVWPSGVIGSISHTAGLAAAVALNDRRLDGIGIDIERLIIPAARRALSAMVVDDGELAYLRSLATTASIDWLLTITFSAKESFFKGAFAAVRRCFNFHAVALAELSLHDGSVTLQLRETLADCLVRGQRCRIGFKRIRPDVVLSSFMLAPT